MDNSKSRYAEKIAQRRGGQPSHVDSMSSQGKESPEAKSIRGGMDSGSRTMGERQERGRWQKPTRSPQHQSYHREPDRPLNLSKIVEVANRDLEAIDSTMFSVGDIVDERTFPGKRY